MADIFLVHPTTLQIRRASNQSVAKKFVASEPDAGWLTATDADLSALPAPLMVKLYNKAADKPITKFESREVAERRFNGVLEYLAPTRDYVMAPVIEPKPVVVVVGGEPKPKKAPKAKKEPKPKAERMGAPVKVIDEVTLSKTILMRREGKTWAEICTALGQPINFVFRVRPLLRAHDATLVKNIGPGSEGYGKGPTKRPSAKRERQPSAPVEAF